MSENLKKFLALIANNKELEAKALACNELGEEKCKLAFLKLAKENGINLIEAGHYYTESPALSALADTVKAAIPNAEIIFSDSNNIKAV